jgi:hypothetical protein
LTWPPAVAARDAKGVALRENIVDCLALLGALNDIGEGEEIEETWEFWGNSGISMQ